MDLELPGQMGWVYQKKVWATCIVILATSMHSTNTLAVTKLAYLESVFAAYFIGCYCGLWLYRKAIPTGMMAGAMGQFLASPSDQMKVHLQMEGKGVLQGLEPR